MFFKGRFGCLYLFFVVFAALSFATRTVLAVKALPVLEATPWLISKVYTAGFFFDLVTMLYFALPFVVYLILVPDRVYRHACHRPAVYAVSFFVVYLLVFTCFAEYIFFDEFGVRFNFIAVDYLIYTTEVVKNIRESYPMPLLLSAIAAISLAILLPLRKWLEVSLTAESTIRRRFISGLPFLALPLLPFLLVDLSLAKVSSNSYANELAANGIYSFFAAFRNNQLQYEDFYETIDQREVILNLKARLREKKDSFPDDTSFSITRAVRNEGEEQKLNVAVIVVESLSAEYLGTFGNKSHISPNLDALAEKSLFFTNMHATGTRTDRGLESVTLSVPPTPGRSIVKRPDNEDMFSWGHLMKSRGYDTKFIYGGYGYFDNMNYFFSHNGFATVDRRDFQENEIVFENAWGVSDEDLFNRCIKEFNSSYRKQKPFFSIIMTTSNHRPYTYPEGRIDIRSHTGRDGSVKYTDYAIGKFIRDAQKEPWGRDTIFVIVADHCAGSAGKTALPVKRYEIPLFIYSPAHIKPRKIDTLASQIDIAPTVLELLHFSYTSNFFGRDILSTQPDQERAFIGTYQKLGYIKGDRLVVLDVKKESSVYRFNRNSGEMTKTARDNGLVREAIGYYQGADYLYKHRLNRWKDSDAKQPQENTTR